MKVGKLVSGWNVTLIGALLLAGCGAVSPSPSNASRRPSPSTSVRSACSDDLGSPTRRLTRFELAYAVEDVLNVYSNELHRLPAPLSSIGDAPDIVVGRLLDTSEQFLKPYRAIVQPLVAGAARRDSVDCLADSAGLSACLQARLERVAVRCWRRRVSSAELADLRRHDQNEAATAEDATATHLRALTRVFLSPRFYLLQNEKNPRDTVSAAQRTLSRLSLVLWSSVPDYEQVVKADAGAFASTEQFERLVTEMVADPRFKRFSLEFTRQWLRLDRRPFFRISLEERGLAFDPQRLDSIVRAATDIVSKRARLPLVELLDSPANEATYRPGLLTSAALLTTVSSSIRGGGDEVWLGRGLLVQSAFLCRTFPLAAVYDHKLWQTHPLLDPHQTADTPRPSEAGLLAIRTRDRPCRECHRQLETIGAALADFDGLGEPRPSPGTHPSSIAGYDVLGAQQLSAWIARSGRFEPCVAQKLLTYVLGRAVLPQMRAEDRCRVAELTADGSASLQSMLSRALNSSAFREQGSQVVRDLPTTLPDSRLYTEALKLPKVDYTQCKDFVPGEFLVRNCGSAACHGIGTRGALFAVPDRAQAAAFLQQSRPRRDGYCAHESSYLNSERPLESLLVRKVTAIPQLCGAPMPITGGPRSLSPSELACFVAWASGLAQ